MNVNFSAMNKLHKSIQNKQYIMNKNQNEIYYIELKDFFEF